MSDDYRLNMPIATEMLFKLALRDEGWSWDGLAQLLKKEYPNDIEDFIYCLQGINNKFVS